MFRLNYGNGQVGPTKRDYSEAKRELVSLRNIDHAESFRIERYEAGTADAPGDWVRLGAKGRLKTLERKGL